MRFFMDMAYVKAGKMSIIGWAAPEEEGTVLHYAVLDKNGAEKELEQVVTTRPDLGYALFRDPERPDLGYFLRFPYKGNEQVTVRITEKRGEETVGVLEKKLSRTYITYRMTGKKIKRRMKSGIDFVKKVENHFLHTDDREYRDWFLKHRADEETLNAQRERTFEIAPKISVVVPLYKTPLQYFEEMAESVLSQTYGNLELVLVNASKEDEALSEAATRLAEKDSRVTVVTLEENLGISENTNRGIEASAGEFIALLDHDDTIEPDALYDYVEALNQDPAIELFYSDEDKITEDKNAWFYPNFKPDFAIDFLRANNYMCHFLMTKKALFERLGGYRKEYDGAQDHDMILRIAETTDHIFHFPRILYHWRSIATSTASGVGVKDYAKSAGIRAIEAHYERVGIPATVTAAAVDGWYVSRYTLSRRPLVSVLIPNKDHVKDLQKCLESLYHKSTYREIEVIVIENNSTDPKTFAFYEEAKSKYPDLSVVKYEGKFNYAAVNNLGAKHAKGEYLLLLNNDIEADAPDFLESMMGYGLREDVGIVGAKLLYPDRTVQHAGVLVGFGGIAGHLFKNLKENEPGYMCRAISTTDVSAVTAACLLVKKALYEQVGGLDEAFEVAFNDVDFCLKVRATGKLIVYDAEAKLIHAESKSRGVEDTPEKFRRFAGESRRLSEKWGILRVSGKRFEDPYYNPNFSYLEYFKLDTYDNKAAKKAAKAGFGNT